MTIGTAAPEDADEVVAWERRHLPGWEEFFAAPFASGELEDVQLARGPAPAPPAPRACRAEAQLPACRWARGWWEEPERGG